MKKFISGLLIGMIIAASGLLYANNVYDTQLASFKVLVNGNEYNSTENPALVVNGRTYLPVKGIGDALGVPVAWNKDANRVEVGNTKGGNGVVNKGPVTKSNTIDTGEGFVINFTGYKYVIAGMVFEAEIKNKTDQPIQYDMSNITLSAYEFKINSSTLTKGTLEKYSSSKGELYFSTVDTSMLYLFSYKDKQIRLDINNLKKLN